MFRYFSIAVLLLFAGGQQALAQAEVSPQAQEAPKRTNLPPLMERYILDELKALRTEFERLRSDTRIDLSEREVRLASEAMNYSNNTVTFFFYVFAIVGAALTIIGWRSFVDLKHSIGVVAEKELKRLSDEYEARLTALERDLTEKGSIIIDNQHEIEKTQKIHALWLQANQTPDARTKIAIYEQILELDPQDYEAIAYKADAALQLGDREWALSLCNRVLDENEGNALAHYFRACAAAGLHNTEDALADLQRALELSPGLVDQARQEEDFEEIKELPAFVELVGPPLE